MFILANNESGEILSEKGKLIVNRKFFSDAFIDCINVFNITRIPINKEIQILTVPMIQVEIAGIYPVSDTVSCNLVRTYS